MKRAPFDDVEDSGNFCIHGTNLSRYDCSACDEEIERRTCLCGTGTNEENDGWFGPCNWCGDMWRWEDGVRVTFDEWKPETPAILERLKAEFGLEEA